MSALPSFCRTCKKRESGNDSDASSEGSAEDPAADAASELGRDDFEDFLTTFEQPDV